MAKQSRGTCLFCGKESSKGALTRHLSSCPARAEANAKADAGSGKPETLLHLKVQDGYGPDFWLHLEMRGSASLKDLDRYLRAIWLECCGHLSQFSFGGWSGHEIAMSRKVEQVFTAAGGQPLTHIYDFGTESVTQIELLGTRTGKPLTKHPIFLMARNLAPVAVCQICGKPAEFVCMECVYEEDESGFLCAAHAEDHPHEEYGEPMQLYNSPRTGMCGYDGPALPPY